MFNIDTLPIKFLQALSSHPTLLQCPICDQIDRTNDEFMSHFRSHPKPLQVIFLARGFSMLGITSSIVSPPERHTRSTREERVMPQIPLLPPPSPSPSPSSHRSFPIRGNDDDTSVHANSIGLNLNEIPSESTRPQDVPLQNIFDGLINIDDETNDELDLDLKL
ncbi:hypothetical protein RND71_004753 [Anisodus tanguticus]|uniref:Uncharacterized protein n=1 Tax=Anisodus tanguticus TaxID=243964 RepID=A0AAE1SST9_9SOLA|nr:hypothetical protein RND71_004753 [Anisodus tanguticus]